MQGIKPPSVNSWQNTFPATPTADLGGTTITAHSTIHTKGSYTELISSVAQDCYGFWLTINGTGATSTRTDILLDIAIGAASSEVVILPNFLAGWRPANTAGSVVVWIPLFIKKGERISARCQALISSDTVNVGLILNCGKSAPTPIFSGCDVYGIDTATSQGTSHTPGATGSESTAANIGGTTSKNYGAVMLMLGGIFSGTVITAIGHHWELILDSATIAEWKMYETNVEILFVPIPPAPINVSVPAGTQLKVRAESSGTASAHDVALYCFY